MVPGRQGWSPLTVDRPLPANNSLQTIAAVDGALLAVEHTTHAANGIPAGESTF